VEFNHKNWKFEKKAISKYGKLVSFFSMRNPLYRLKSFFFENKVVQALLTFQKPGPLSLIWYAFIGQ